MRHVRDVISMKAAGLPSREISRRVGAAPSTVRPAIRRFEAAGLTWPLPDELTDTALELRLFAKTGNGNRQGHRRIAAGSSAVRRAAACHTPLAQDADRPRRGVGPRSRRRSAMSCRPSTSNKRARNCSAPRTGLRPRAWPDCRKTIPDCRVKRRRSGRRCPAISAADPQRRRRTEHHGSDV